MDGMMASGCAPVLLIVFNRPEPTRQVFEAIASTRPRRLFVAGDGPRSDRDGEAGRCAEARAVVDAVDWPCEIMTLFQDENLGCKVGVQTAITWFFSHVEAGIILEDDCIPSPSFFGFATEMLERYASRPDVMMVSGTNSVGEWRSSEQSYHFAYNAAIWGWATWRDAWRHYDPDMTVWAAPEGKAQLRATVTDPAQYRWHSGHFDQVLYHGYDTWDWAWDFARLRLGGSGVVPSKNLVTNIGFGQDATHTFIMQRKVANKPAAELTFPLRAPADGSVDRRYDREAFERMNTRLRRVKQAIVPYAPWLRDLPQTVARLSRGGR